MNNSALEGLTHKMEMIEHRYPEKYMKLKSWQKLNATREYLSVQYAKQQIEWHKDRISRMGERDAANSAKLVPQLTKFVKGREKNNENILR